MSAEAGKNPSIQLSKKHVILKYYPKFRFLKESWCMNCNKTEKELGMTLKTCQRCKTALYCSKMCQRENFLTHKHDCKSTIPPFSKGLPTPWGEQELLRNLADPLSSLRQMMTSTLYILKIALFNPSVTGFNDVKKMATFIMEHSRITAKDNDLFDIALSLRCFSYLYMDDIKSVSCLLRYRDRSWIISALFEALAEEVLEKSEYYKILGYNAHITNQQVGGPYFDPHHTPLDILCGLLGGLFGSDHINQELEKCSLPILTVICGMQYLARDFYQEKFGKKWPEFEIHQVFKAIEAKNTKLLKLIAEPERLDPYFPEIPDNSSSEEHWALFVMSYAWPLFNKITGCREDILTYLYPGVTFEYVPNM